MSFEQLEERGVFLPEEQWEEMDLSGSIPSWAVVVAWTVFVGSCILMVWGGGGAMTWLGAGLFAVSLVGYAWIASRSVDRQNEVVRRLDDRSGDGAESDASDDD